MGGSGGGGGPYFDVNPEALEKLLQDSKQKIVEGFSGNLEQILQSKLAHYNDRDADLVNRRLDEVKKCLIDNLYDSVDLSFGGSVAKHTYVDGLSDVDSLLILKDIGSENSKPSEVQQSVEKLLAKELGDANVSHGKLAITVRYKDGMELQLIPSIRAGAGIKVPSWSADKWSKIDPKKFQDGLIKRNKEFGGKLIPTIKLAKAVVANWPESVRLSGYHIESLAIDAFRNYKGSKTVSNMLPVFFERAASAVNSPIRDKTGQSLHVDEYLGKSGGIERRKVSHWCSQTSKKMNQASMQGSVSKWNEFFE